MPTEFKKLPNEPVVVVTLPKEYDLASELPVLLPKYLSFLDSTPTPVYWIVDARNAPLKVEEIIIGAKLVSSGKHPLYHHKNIRQVIYVTSNEIMKLAAIGLKNEAFGRIMIKLFDDMDEVMKYIREDK